MKSDVLIFGKYDGPSHCPRRGESRRLPRHYARRPPAPVSTAPGCRPARALWRARRPLPGRPVPKRRRIGWKASSPRTACSPTGVRCCRASRERTGVRRVDRRWTRPCAVRWTAPTGKPGVCEVVELAARRAAKQAGATLRVVPEWLPCARVMAQEFYERPKSRI